MKIAVFACFALLFASISVFAAKPEKILTCHYEITPILDENGEPTTDEDGEPLTTVETAIINVPDRSAHWQLNKDGERKHPNDFDYANADDAARAVCEALLAEDDDVDEETEEETEEVGILEVRAISLDPVPDLNGNLRTANVAGANNDDLQTPADVIHPNIHQNNGPGNNANPNGANDGGGNMHGIGNNPGQSGDKPNDDGVNGFANELNTVHGGIGSKNKNAE